MLKRSWAAALLAIAGVLSGCSDSAEVRYRVTVTVDDNGVARTGSSVWSVKLSEGGPVTSYNMRFRGEAVAVDLGERGRLFAVLIGRHPNGEFERAAIQMMPEALFGDVGRSFAGQSAVHASRVDDIRSIASRPGQMRVLDCQAGGAQICPLLVRFRDPADPASVEQVVPYDLASAFGFGVSLKTISIEITNDRVNIGIADTFPWWSEYQDKQLDGSRLNRTGTVPATLSIADFSWIEP
jgi:hypothetical protein